MPKFKFSTHLEQSVNGEDAIFIAENGNLIWFCIADGAGGTGSGLKATRQLIEAFKRFTQNNCLPSADDFEAFLRRCDRDLFLTSLGGETTAVVGMVNNSCVVGASVGDSEAWLFNREYDYPLTALQITKPLLGSGNSIPIGFGPAIIDGHLLVSTDGLFKYTPINLLRQFVSAGAKAFEIANLAKTTGETFSDDIAVIIICPIHN